MDPAATTVIDLINNNDDTKLVVDLCCEQEEEVIEVCNSDDSDDDRIIKKRKVTLQKKHVHNNDDDDEVTIVKEGTTPTINSNGNSNRTFCSSSSKRRQRQLYSCEICLEDNLEEYMCYVLSTCHHRFCLNCLSKHIKVSSDDNKTRRIQCPSCPNTLNVMDIRSVLKAVGDDEAWHTYNEKACTNLLESEIVSGIRGTRRCPAERCNYTFVYESRNPEFREGTPFECPSCRQRFCLQCGANNGRVGPSHEGRTCYDVREQLQREEDARRQFEEWKIQNSQADERFERLLMEESQLGITRPCPNCNMPITKNGGCNHMTCRCGYNYNWTTNRRM